MIDGIYLAYPIDQRGPDHMFEMFGQIEKFKTHLIANELAGWVFDPGDAFLVSRVPKGDSVARINRAALNNSDLVVAFLPAGVPSVGVPMEIDRARAQGKHVLLFSDVNSYMLELPGIARMGAWSDDFLKDAYEWIDSLDTPQVSKQYHDLPFIVGPDGNLPGREYDDDAGLDLYVSKSVQILPGTFQDIPSDVFVELPGHTWGLVTGRSSALRKRGLLVHTGVIDAGYRGELFAGAWNMTRDVVVVEKGERIAQLIVIGNGTRYLTPIQTMELTSSMRGERGFGSTGA